MFGGVYLLLDKLLFRFFIIWYICGVILVGFDLLPAWLEWANTVFLIAAGALGGFYFFRQYHWLGLFFSLFIISSTILIEWLGVKFGWFFGHYFYNPDFGLYIADIPLTIGTAWLMVIATTHAIAYPISQVLKPGILRFIFYCLIGAIAAVIMDLILDPVSTEIKEYWVWHGEGSYYGVPFSNFMGWFFIALALHGLLFFFIHLFNYGKKPHQQYWQPRMVLLYILMIVMFSITAIVNAMFLAPLLTICCMALLLFIYYYSRRIA